MMGANYESTWQSIGSIWRTDETHTRPLSERVAQRVHSQSRRLLMILFVEIALTVAMLVLAFTILRRYSATGALRGGAIVLLYTAGVWAFGLWNRRGIWRPFGRTTAEFVHLLRVRAQRRIHSARFTQVIVGLALVVMLTTWRGGSPGRWESGGGAGALFGLYALGTLAWSIWYERRARREMRDLSEYEGQLNAEVVRVAE